MSLAHTRPLKRNTRPKGVEIDLGLAVAGALLPKGETRQLPELAAYAGCSKQLISHIEQTALRKVRAALHQRGIRTLSRLKFSA